MENNDYTGLAKSMVDDRKKAEHFILNYEKEFREYQERKDEFIGQHDATADNAGGGKGNLPGKPVEAVAVKSAQYDMEHQEYLWLKAVEIALRTFGERKRIFITVRREAEGHGKYGIGPGRRAWVVYTQRRYAEEIEKRFLTGKGWMSEKTIRLWWCGIIDCVVEMYLRLKNF